MKSPAQCRLPASLAVRHPAETPVAPVDDNPAQDQPDAAPEHVHPPRAHAAVHVAEDASTAPAAKASDALPDAARYAVPERCGLPHAALPAKTPAQKAKRSPARQPALPVEPSSSWPEDRSFPYPFHLRSHRKPVLTLLSSSFVSFRIH